ncbi:MAG: hypothetical protein E7Z85_06080 [Methanosphaera stadtmanae]|nr:hypothetical protein [Methanosphaera stadtmanae]
MKIYKKIIFLMFLLSILVLSNNIYAIDPVEQNNVPEIINNNNEIQINSNENNEDSYIQYANTDNSLKSAFSNVTRSEKKYNEINLETRTYSLKNTLTTQSNNQFEKTIVINGNNSIIDGNNRLRFAVVDKNITLLLNNLTIRNMNFDIGGALSNTGTLIVNNCTFENNTSTYEDLFGGGAIFNEGSMNITNSSFKNNYAFKSGSSIYTTGNLNNDTYINIENCIFENNVANKESTFHTFGSTTVNIINSIFKNNTSLSGSTIVNQNSNLSITNTLIFNEKTSNILNNNQNLKINNLSIYQNEIEKVIISNDYNLFINNSNIYDNNATKIIENNRNSEIYNTTINNNQVIESLISNLVKNNSKPNLQINKSIISNNSLNYYGVVNDFDSNTVINNTIFHNNTSINNYGIIEDYYGKTYIYNSNFINNTSLNLFKGSLDTFIIVSNNKYFGNNLNTILNINYSNINNIIMINGTIETDEIYNTSVNLGYFNIFQGDNLLSTYICNGTEFRLESYFDNNDNLTLTFLYNGENHFRNNYQELTVSDYYGEYEIGIKNLTDNFVYGDMISYDVILQNSGLYPIENIQLQHLIPDELTLINSTHYINEENICDIPHLNVNETISISINCTPNKFQSLNLLFNILDIKKENYTTFEKNITFISPFIELNDVTSYIGDVVNISANVHNYNKKSMDNITFKFQYKEVDANVTFKDNTITIKDYKISDNLLNKGYVLELICNDSHLDNSFSNSSKLYLSKLDTYSKINYNYSDNYINITGIFYDERNSIINNGTATLKINGISIKTFKFDKGILNITNFRIDKKNQSNESEIMLIYLGNNKYKTNRNFTQIHLTKKEIKLNISYELKNNEITIYAKIEGIENDTYEKGYVSLKINGKSLSQKINITDDNLVVTYDTSNLYNLNNVTISYYGYGNFLENSLTISLKNSF